MLSVALATALLVMAAGCSNGGTEPSSSGSSAAAVNTSGLNTGASLKIWFTTNTEENNELQDIADEFTKQTGIKVEVLDSNFFSVRQKFTTAAKSSEKPDAVYIQSSDLGILVSSDFVSKVDWVTQDMKSRFIPQTFSAFTYNGACYGVGYSAEAYGIIYNKKYVQSIPATWSAYFAQAESMTKKNSSGKITFYGTIINPNNYWFIYPIIKNYGGYYFGTNSDGSYNPKDIGLNNKGTVNALNKLLQLKPEGLTTQAYTQMDSDISQKFADGQVGMFIYGLYDSQSYVDNGVDYGYAALPSNDDGTVSKPLSTVQGFVVNKYSDNQKETAAFLQYVMRDENQLKLFKAGNGGDSKNGARSTCNISVQKSSYTQSSGVLKSLVAVSTTGEVFPSNPEATVIWNYSQTVLNAIFFSNKPVQAELDDFQSKVKSDIASMKS